MKGKTPKAGTPLGGGGHTQSSMFNWEWEGRHPGHPLSQCDWRGKRPRRAWGGREGASNRAWEERKKYSTHRQQPKQASETSWHPYLEDQKIKDDRRSSLPHCWIWLHIGATSGNEIEAKALGMDPEQQILTWEMLIETAKELEAGRNRWHK